MSLKAKVLRELEKKPRRLKELKAKLGNDKKLARLMDELEQDRKVRCTDGVYTLGGAERADAVECTLVKLAPGFGFARPTAGGNGDIFVPGKGLHGAMPGDTVLVRLSLHPRDAASPEGEVEAVLRENNRFTGTIQRVDGRLCLVPDACPAVPLVIKKSADGGAQPGEKAAVEILERGADQSAHRAGVAMRFGEADIAKYCARAVLYSAGISRQFPLKVKAEAKKYDGARVAEKETAKRRDYRAWPIFTIDSADTCDIDDAISVERTPDGYRLGVHIADVSHYVRPGTALDDEAMRRGTSVYYADSVAPMLPRQLSNGICSLNEGEDRLAFSCVMELDGAGTVTDYAFEKSVIRSRVKGVYSEVNALLEGGADTALTEKYAPVMHSLPIFQELYYKLARQRAARGAMEIESGESKLVLDEAGRCVDVQKRQRGMAECMIEEFMLLANSCAAGLARRLEIPFVYRVHAAPDPARIDALRDVLHAAGVEFHTAADTPTALELSKLLSDTRATPLERFVHTSVLRSMAKADYEPQPKGHFGLAIADYAHFTSPIRRYPDLAIHRILTDVCAGQDAASLHAKYDAFAAEASAHSSEREVAAMQAERDIEDCYKAEFMHGKIGEEFDGVISGVTAFGVYVELPSTVEGLVRAAALSERPLVFTQGVSLRDPVSGRTWKLGDALRVRVSGADVAAGNVDFEPAASGAGAPK